MRAATLVAGGLLLTQTVCAEEAAQSAAAGAPVEARFVDARGREIGTARLTEVQGGVLIEIDVSQLPPGEHAFHVHQTGKCDPADGFKSAGDHYAPRKRMHGIAARGGPHAGDMPNQFVHRDGVLRAHVINRDVSLRGGEAPLRDDDGSALVIHARPDDYRSQPSGDAGDRIACAVIAPPAARTAEAPDARERRRSRERRAPAADEEQR